VKNAFRLLFGLLALGAAAEAAAQPPGWMLDNEFMPQRGRIGIRMQPMTPELRGFFEAPSDRGVLISSVEPDRPAAAAGIQVGDVVVAADGDTVREPFDLVKAVARVPAGQKLTLAVIRKGEAREFEIEPEGGPVPWADPESWRDWLDRRMREGGEQLRERLQELEQRLEELERRLDQKAGSQQTSL
jgi:membrane-associated protease RseP (regulator of RpoE activity)